MPEYPATVASSGSGEVTMRRWWTQTHSGWLTSQWRSSHSWRGHMGVLWTSRVGLGEMLIGSLLIIICQSTLWRRSVTHSGQSVHIISISRPTIIMAYTESEYVRIYRPITYAYWKRLSTNYMRCLYLIFKEPRLILPTLDYLYHPPHFFCFYFLLFF